MRIKLTCCCGKGIEVEDESVYPKARKPDDAIYTILRLVSEFRMEHNSCKLEREPETSSERKSKEFWKGWWK